MRAEPAQQQRLLDLQALDTRLSQLDHRLRTLPERAEVDRLAREHQDVEDEVVRARTALSDLEREVTKAESDVQLVRDRADRDRARLESGTGSSKDLQALQHELESLARRQSTLEDEQLEVMERAEQAESELARAEERLAGVAEQLERATAQRDEVVGELTSQREEVERSREPVVGELPADLLALYDRIRATSGTGAAALSRRSCGGCQLELNTVELGRIRAADPDEVLRCEECRRILVRTPESGL
ncbi:zinc ribbon domain-containing protein [Ornithinicoccus halotolerans]|uniref:zinc ribbon domain-containing protein n=1 Tax=Ornithinicoccus halotolerans TaxID=1748220 RepID=UPI0012964E3A|nr:C4-type zinc ribbon domain-containing protein [Ornithinicoccus halotolerans]